MGFLNVLVHRASVGKNSITMYTRELFTIMQTFSVSFQIGFSSKGLATLRTSMDFHYTRMLFFPMTEKAAFGLEQFTAILASQVRNGTVVFMVVRC